MNTAFSLATLETTKSLIQNGGSEAQYLENLENMGIMVNATASNEQMRSMLANDNEVFEVCEDILAVALSLDLASDKETVLYVRTLRAAVLLLRNLVPMCPRYVDVPLLLLSIQHFAAKIDVQSDFFDRCLASYLQLLANVVLKAGSDFSCSIHMVGDTFKGTLLEVISNSQDPHLKRPLNILLSRVLTEANVSQLLGNQSLAPLLEYIFSSCDYDELEGSQELQEIIEHLVTNESFVTFVQVHNSVPLLEVCQLIITSKDDWDNRDVTVLINWAFGLFKELSPKAGDLLKAESPVLEELEVMNSKLIKVLDIVSDLCKFHTVKGFLDHYNALESIIPFLRVVHENTEINTKKGETKTGKKGSKKFPMVKTLVMEILAFVCHDSPQAQDKVRELHGLELVLSNCMIDDDNPYIKERSILCLKFLLHQNAKNQEFVAQLEAKQVVDGDALRDAGYEVSIKNGNVELKKAEPKTT